MVHSIVFVGRVHLIIGLLAWCFYLVAITAFAGSKGLERVVVNQQGFPAHLYQQSHALLIGISDYRRGWPNLKSVPAELKLVKETLEKQGFTTTMLLNPSSRSLKLGFEQFINRYGFTKNNRLLVFYSGHGYTRKDGSKGYLVPVDSPNPQSDEAGFLRTALPMTRILSWSREIESNHVLFLFDSCFSGTIFKTKSFPAVPPHISRLAAQPVRQYITAGSAGEEVPAKSVFTPILVDALKHGFGDLNKDGYITGSELGVYIQGQVPKYTPQTPQFGKINDYELSKGDYVFRSLKQVKPTGYQPKMIAYRQPVQEGAGFFNRLKSYMILPPGMHRKKESLYVGTGIAFLSMVRLDVNKQMTTTSTVVSSKSSYRQTIVPIILGYEKHLGKYKIGGETDLLLSSNVLGIRAGLFLHRYLGNRFSAYTHVGINSVATQNDDTEFFRKGTTPCDWDQRCDTSVFPSLGIGLQYYTNNRFSFRWEYFIGTISNGWTGSTQFIF